MSHLRSSTLALLPLFSPLSDILLILMSLAIPDRVYFSTIEFRDDVVLNVTLASAMDGVC